MVANQPALIDKFTAVHTLKIIAPKQRATDQRRVITLSTETRSATGNNAGQAHNTLTLPHDSGHHEVKVVSSVRLTKPREYKQAEHQQQKIAVKTKLFMA